MSSLSASEVIALEDDSHLAVYKRYPLVVERGRDVWIETAEGRRFLDLYGGHAVALTGHCHPRTVEAIRRQAEDLLFYSNLVYSRTRAQAAHDLLEVAPAPLSRGRVFFVNSGAEANENALKIARMTSGHERVLSFEGSFHGRTAGALSATGIASMRQAAGPLLPQHCFAPFGDLSAAERTADEGPLAAVLVEPIQSMAGVRSAPAGFYQGLRRLCDQTGALLIYDEIQTGLGRIGDYFFSGRFGVVPDMLTLAKGMAAGLPMGAVIVGAETASRLSYGDLGTTFGGGPLACAALSSVLDTIESEGLIDNVRLQSGYLKDRLKQVSGVKKVLGSGFLIGIRFEDGAVRYKDGLFEKGILCGLSHDPQVLRLLPPLTLRQPEIDLFLDALESLSANGH